MLFRTIFFFSLSPDVSAAEFDLTRQDVTRWVRRFRMEEEKNVGPDIPAGKKQLQAVLWKGERRPSSAF